MLTANWNERIGKLRNTVYSWIGRYFANLKQRIEILNCFALSRIFYVAAVIPLTRSALQTINSIIGDFIWKNSGKVLRIARDELVNSEIKGGLGLLDTEAMCNSLIASQTFRLMKSCDSKSQKHLYYWMHGVFENVWN